MTAVEPDGLGLLVAVGLAVADGLEVGALVGTETDETCDECDE